MPNVINDFGEKIGGAKKDIWGARGLQVEDITDFNDAERAKYITKNNIWKTPDYQVMREEGYSVPALFFIKSVKDALPAKPTLQAKEENYIEFISLMRTKLLNIKTDSDINAFNKQFLIDEGLLVKDGYYYSTAGIGESVIDNKLLKTMRLNSSDCKSQAVRKGFLYTTSELETMRWKILNLNEPNISVDKGYDDKLEIRESVPNGTYFYHGVDNSHVTAEVLEDHPYVAIYGSSIVAATSTREELQEFIDGMINAVVKKEEQEKENDKGTGKTIPKRKPRLVPPQLEDINRLGPRMLSKDISGQDFIDTFNIKGGEFGNWLNDKDRQVNMNFAYDSFKDLALAIGISDKDISLDNRLNIAFGARGSGAALAHYEMEREVVNLTKMKGAGSLAHEFFHAVDNIIAKRNGLSGDAFSTNRPYAFKNLPSFKNLADALRYKPATNDDIKDIREQNLKNSLEKLKKNIDIILPDTRISPELVQRKNEWKDKLIDMAEKASHTEGKEFLEVTIKGRNLKTHPSADLSDFFSFVTKDCGSNNMKNNNQEVIARNLDTIKSCYQIQREPIDIENSKPVSNKFYNDASTIDDNFSRSGHGYWNSIEEMAARAFACYVKDKLSDMGITNDYLVGHAETPAIDYNGEKLYAYPIGEDRERINKAFNDLFIELKEKGIFTQREDITPSKDSFEYITNGKEYDVSINGNTVKVSGCVNKECAFSTPEKAQDVYINLRNDVERNLKELQEEIVQPEQGDDPPTEEEYNYAEVAEGEQLSLF